MFCPSLYKKKLLVCEQTLQEKISENGIVNILMGYIDDVLLYENMEDTPILDNHILSKYINNTEFYYRNYNLQIQFECISIKDHKNIIYIPNSLLMVNKYNIKHDTESNILYLTNKRHTYEIIRIIYKSTLPKDIENYSKSLNEIYENIYILLYRYVSFYKLNIPIKYENSYKIF